MVYQTTMSQHARTHWSDCPALRGARCFLIAATIMAACTCHPAQAQQTCDDIAALNDEFDNAMTVADWTNETVVDDWPSQIAVLDVHTTLADHLYIETEVSSWYQDYRGVLLYKEVTGDFVVTTRVRARGLDSDTPMRSFSLAGVMVRQPRHEAPGGWTPSQENWLFITTGAGSAGGNTQVETKNTVDSVSVLELTPSTTGWVDLRIRRLGDTYELFRRFEGEDWHLARTIVRDDLPATVQVGLVAYTDWPTVSGYPGGAAEFNEVLVTSPPGHRDLIAEFDYIRFERPTEGVVYEPADYDHSGSIDLEDWRALSACLAGPGTPYTDPCCARADADSDDDVDLLDAVVLLERLGN